MNESFEIENDEEVQWEIDVNGKEVTEETKRFFYDTFKQLRFENDELKGKTQAISNTLEQEKRILKQNKEKLKEISIRNEITQMQLQDIENASHSKSPIKQKYRKEQFDESTKLIQDGKSIKEEIDQNEVQIQNLELELLKTSRKLESKKHAFNLNFETVRKEYEKLKRQYDFLKEHSPELFQEYDDEYSEDESNNQQTESEEEENEEKVIVSSIPQNKEIKINEITEEKTNRRQTQQQTILNQTTQSKKTKPKCSDPDINAYQIDFNFMPSGTPERKKGENTLIFSSGEDITKCKDGTLIIHGKKFTLIRYSNGDILQKFKDNATAYQYKETGAVEINLPDTTTVTKFANKQIEIRFPNGDVKVQFPDGIIKYFWKDGTEETIQL